MGLTDSQLFGPVLSEHRWHALSMFELYGSLFVPLLAAIGSMVAVVALARSDGHTVESITIICAVLSASAAWFAVMFHRSRQGLHKVVVRADGLEWDGATGSGAQPWAEVAEVAQCDVRGDPAAAEQWTTVRFRGGVLLTFDRRLLQFKKLCDVVRELTTPHILATKVAELATGGGATFGRVAVRPDGLTFGGRHRTWPELHGWRIVNGCFCLGDERSGAFLWSAGHWEIPNFPAFCALLAAVWKPPLPPKKLGGRF